MDDTHRLESVRKDYHAKSDNVYLVTDRCRDWLLMGQSIPLLVEWLNAAVAHERHDRVTTSGLHETLKCKQSRDGGFHRGRFKLERVPLEDSKDVFERMRAEYKRAAIVQAMPNRYRVVRSV